MRRVAPGVGDNPLVGPIRAFPDPDPSSMSRSSLQVTAESAIFRTVRDSCGRRRSDRARGGTCTLWITGGGPAAIWCRTGCPHCLSTAHPWFSTSRGGSSPPDRSPSPMLSTTGDSHTVVIRPAPRTGTANEDGDGDESKDDDKDKDATRQTTRTRTRTRTRPDMGRSTGCCSVIAAAARTR